MTRVLIVDDHGIVRAGLASLFETDEELCVTGMAENGTQALQMLVSGTETDVVLTDLRLGDMTGIELTRSILERFPAIKVMILTIETDDRYLTEAFKAGVKGYLLKETSYDELFWGIKKVNAGKKFICTSLIARLSQRLIGDQFYRKQKEANIELSQREAEILHLLADGYTNLEIADRLFTSRRTVEGHRQALLNKTGVRNTPELIKYAMLHGLLQLDAIT